MLSNRKKSSSYREIPKNARKKGNVIQKNAIYLGVGCFPAFIDGEGSFAFVIALWIFAGVQKIMSDLANIIIQFVYVRLNLIKVWITIVVNYITVDRVKNVYV